MKKRGFTLVELLVVIVILGIVAGLSIPLIRNLTVAFDKRKYESYADSVLYAAKLYNDSYSEDLFGHNEYGCCYITYDDLEEKNLIKDIEVEGMSCNSDMTYVRVNKQKDKVSYTPYVSCGKKSNGAASEISLSIPKEVPEKDIIACTCTNEPNISITADTSEAPEEIKKNRKKTKVTLTSGTGIGSKIVIYTKWSRTWNNYEDEGFEKLDFKVIDNQEKILETSSVQTTSNEILTPPADGEYYLIIRVDYLEDLYGNKWKNTQSDDPNSKYITIMPPFVITGYEDLSDISLIIGNETYDKTKKIYNWTNKDIKLHIKSTAFTNITGFWATTNPGDAVWPQIEDVELGKTEVEFDKWFRGDTQKSQYFVRACDEEGNCIEKNTWVQIDKLPPTLNIVKNSSSGKWTKDDVTIGVEATDKHSGIDKYLYSYISNPTKIGEDPASTWVEIPAVTDNRKCLSATGKNVSACGVQTFSINDGEVLNKTIYITVVDKAGNYSNIVHTEVKQDRTVPTITSVDNPYNDKWINKKFTVVIKATDTGSGINKYYWSNSSNAKPETSTYWGQLTECGTGKTTCNSSWSKQRNDTIYLKVCDVVGNCSNRSYTKIKIDTTKPTCTVKKTKTGTSGVSTSVSCKDSGGSGYKSCPNGNSGLKSSKTYTVTDYAGNSNTCTAKVTKKCTKYRCGISAQQIIEVHHQKTNGTWIWWPSGTKSKSECKSECESLYRSRNGKLCAYGTDVCDKVPSGADKYYIWKKNEYNEKPNGSYDVYFSCGYTKNEADMAQDRGGDREWRKNPKHYPPKNYSSNKYGNYGCCACCYGWYCDAHTYV